MNNSSISTWYRNVLGILHIHLCCYFKASLPVAPSSVQQLNKFGTPAALPCKTEDQINNACSWQPNCHFHHASPDWSWVHRSGWMCSLFSAGCWTLQGELQAQLITRFVRLHPLFTYRSISKTPFSPALTCRVVIPSLGDISLFVSHGIQKVVITHTVLCVSLSCSWKLTGQKSTCSSGTSWVQSFHIRVSHKLLKPGILFFATADYGLPYTH